MHMIWSNKFTAMWHSLHKFAQVTKKSVPVVSSELHSSDRIGQQGKKDQQLSLKSGPTLYRRVPATRAINPSREILRPQSPLSTGHGCAAIQKPLKDPEFELSCWSFFPCRPILSELWSLLLTTVSNQLTNTQWHTQKCFYLHQDISMRLHSPGTMHYIMWSFVRKSWECHG